MYWCHRQWIFVCRSWNKGAENFSICFHIYFIYVVLFFHRDIKLCFVLWFRFQKAPNMCSPFSCLNFMILLWETNVMRSFALCWHTGLECYVKYLCIWRNVCIHMTPFSGCSIFRVFTASLFYIWVKFSYTCGVMKQLWFLAGLFSLKPFI